MEVFPDVLHLTALVLQRIIFPSFSALFRDIGALPSLERLNLDEVQWNGACDPDSPPSSTATFGGIKTISAKNCSYRGWPLVWVLGASSLRYTHPWRTAPDDVEEAHIRSVRVDVRVTVQAVRWMLGSAGDRVANMRLAYVGYAPRGAESSSGGHAFRD